MAQFHFRAKVIGRKGGRSAVASAAYRAGELLRLNGEVFDYSRRKGIEAAFILTPEIPAAARKQKPLRLALDQLRADRQALWQMVEASEKRKDAQLARELEISLPLELTPEQRRALIEGFVRDQLTSAGMIADVAIHTGDAGGKAQQPHAHVMLTLRSLNADGTFGQKAREWNAPALLEGWRAAWAEATNAALEAAGHSVRVDHRSLEARRAVILAQIEAEPDDVARLRLQGQAAALDYIPQVELSPTEWRAMESGHWPPEFSAKIEAFQLAAESKTAAAELSAAYSAAADELAAERVAEIAAAARAAREAEVREMVQARREAEAAERMAAERAAERAERAAQRRHEAEAARRAREAEKAALRAAQEAQEAQEAKEAAEVRKVGESVCEPKLLPVAQDRAVTNFKVLREAKPTEREDWTAQRLSEPHGAGFMQRLARLSMAPFRVGAREREDDRREEVAKEDLANSGFVRRVAEQVGTFIRERAIGVFGDSEGWQKREDRELCRLAWAEAGAFHAPAPEVRTRADIMAERSPGTDQAPPPLDNSPAPRRPRGGGLSR